MSISHFFEQLGAPLANNRWSWGAVTTQGLFDPKKVFLRVWNDERQAIDGVEYIRLINREAYRDHSHPGYNERLRQIDALTQDGIIGFGVMVWAEDPNVLPRTIRQYNANAVYPLGAIKLLDGDEWVELHAPQPASSHFV